MEKTKLNKFIQKYNLGGNVNSVKWKSDGDKLTTTQGVKNILRLEKKIYIK